MPTRTGGEPAGSEGTTAEADDPGRAEEIGGTEGVAGTEGAAGTEVVVGSERAAEIRGTEGEIRRSVEPGRLNRTWYRSRVGIAIVAVDLLLTVLLVAAATVAYDGAFAGVETVSAGVVPPYVPVFSLLGALGFVFTTLIERFDGSAGRLLRYNFHLPAALPLGVGVFLLSDVILTEAGTNDALVAGIVFLSGLYVNLAYKRLGALARRLLPGRRGRSSGREDGPSGREGGSASAREDGSTGGGRDSTGPDRDSSTADGNGSSSA